MSKRKIKVIALSLGQAFSRLIGLAVMMLMARVLLKEDLAAYRQAFLAYLAVGPMLSLGVGQGMYYFLPSETERLRGRVADGVAALGAMGVLFALFIGLGGNELLAQRFSNPQVCQVAVVDDSLCDHHDSCDCHRKCSRCTRPCDARFRIWRDATAAGRSFNFDTAAVSGKPRTHR